MAGLSREGTSSEGLKGLLKGLLKGSTGLLSNQGEKYKLVFHNGSLLKKKEKSMVLQSPVKGFLKGVYKGFNKGLNN